MTTAAPPPTLNLKAVQAGLRTRWLGRELVYKRRTTSTMDEARKAALQGAAAGTIVLAEEQSAGRGTKGRDWVSPPGQNLYCTVVLRPNPEKLKRLSMVTAVAIANAVEQIHGLFPRIKWPNDLQFDGKKFAGILIEAEWERARPAFALVGMGLDVNFDPEAYAGELTKPATSLAIQRGRHVLREPLLAAVCNALERSYEGAESEALFNGWRARLDSLGRSLTVATSHGPVEGFAEDVEEDGTLLLRVETGDLLQVTAAEVIERSRGAPEKRGGRRGG